MEDLLAESRKKFKKDFEIASTFKNEEFVKALIKDQIKIERIYKRGFLLNEIKNLGLEKYTEEIIDGMNEIIGTLNMAQQGYHIPKEKIPEHITNTNNWTLTYGIEYIHKWKMYNELFGDIKE